MHRYATPVDPGWNIVFLGAMLPAQSDADSWLQGIGMLKDYFGDFATGRVKSAQFIALWLVLFVAFVVFMVLIGFGIGIAEQMLGGSVLDAQLALRTNIDAPTVIVIFSICCAFMVAKLNIIAKRFRDTGLPGWLTTVIFAGLLSGSTHVVGETTTGSVSLILLLILAFIPTDAFRRRA
ncbi:MAG: DUF805 domain-containing protein [Pseudomonadota bacterium]